MNRLASARTDSYSIDLVLRHLPLDASGIFVAPSLETSNDWHRSGPSLLLRPIAGPRGFDLPSLRLSPGTYFPRHSKRS
jgi:hypothetical protein